jgi:uncharacterized Zn finger protein
MPIPNLTERSLQQLATDKSYARGEDYYRRGMVRDLCLRGDTLYGKVVGNESQPYQIRLKFDRDGITEACCDCYYDLGGWCKHLVAVGLTDLRAAAGIRSRPSLTALLANLDRSQTETLIEKLVDNHPDLLTDIDLFVSQIGSIELTDPAPGDRVKIIPSIDTEPYRYQTQQMMAEWVQYWEEGAEDSPLDRLPEILAGARDLIERGDGENAIEILAAVTQTCAESWGELADYDPDSDGEQLMNILDPIWTETILSTALTPQQTRDWQEELAGWQDRFGLEFEMADRVLKQGWNSPELVAVLAGESEDLWGEDIPYYADNLNTIRLQILARQERYTEYLNLARSTELIELYLMMLVNLDRLDEVMANRQRIKSAREALVTAQALRGKNAITASLSIARTGLSLPDYRPQSNSAELSFSRDRVYVPDRDRYQLADWTSNFATELGDIETALSARITAFKLRPTLQDYHRIESFAGDDWQQLKLDLLAHLQTVDSWQYDTEKVGILLYEGAIDAAVKAVSDGYHSEYLVWQVMDAAIDSHPQWIIDKSRQSATAIVDRAKADAYQTAVNWLMRMRSACMRADRETEWQDYRSQLFATHGRKRKLMTLMSEHQI